MSSLSAEPLRIQSSSEPYFLPRLWAAVGPAGPIMLCHSGTSASFQVLAGFGACLRGKQHRLYLKSQVFLWAGVEVGRREVGGRGHSWWLRVQGVWERGGWRAPPVLPTSSGRVHRPPSVPPEFKLGRDSPLEVMPA